MRLRQVVTPKGKDVLLLKKENNNNTTDDADHNDKGEENEFINRKGDKNKMFSTTTISTDYTSRPHINDQVCRWRYMGYLKKLKTKFLGERFFL